MKSRISAKSAKPSAFWSKRFSRPAKPAKPAVFRIWESIKHKFCVFRAYRFQNWYQSNTPLIQRAPADKSPLYRYVTFDGCFRTLRSTAYRSSVLVLLLIVTSIGSKSLNRRKRVGIRLYEPFLLTKWL